MNSDKRLERVVGLIKLYEQKISFNKEWIKTHYASPLKDEIPEVKMKIKILKSIVKNLKWAVGKKHYA